MPGKKIYMRLLSPERADEKNPDDKRVDRVEMDADMVIMRCVNGDWGVLPEHAPRSAVLDDDERGALVRVKDGDEERQFIVRGGLAEVRKRNENDDVSDEVVTVITILSGYAESAGTVTQA